MALGVRVKAIVQVLLWLHHRGCHIHTCHSRPVAHTVAQKRLGEQWDDDAILPCCWERGRNEEMTAGCLVSQQGDKVSDFVECIGNNSFVRVWGGAEELGQVICTHQKEDGVSMNFLVLKSIHLSCATISITLFFLRGI